MAKTVLAELVTQMTVESAQFKKELEKATAKTTAFNNKQQQAANDSRLFDKRLVEMAGKAKQFATAVAGGVAVVGGLTAAMFANANASAKNAVEIQKLANVAGMTVEEFQAMSFAFTTLGVDQDKFGDIAKDVKDKIGDFIATGGGEFADFLKTSHR